MKNYIQSQRMPVLLAIVKGPHIQTIKKDGSKVPKVIEDWNNDDLAKIKDNAAAINFLHCTLDTNEFNKVSRCETAQEIQKKLEVTYEGKWKVREIKNSIIVREYELLQMEHIDDVQRM